MRHITTHLEGTLFNAVGEPYKDAIIIAEMTDQDDSWTGIRSKAYCNEYGEYKFKLVGGYHNLYVLENEDAVEVKLGKVHVAPSDYDKTYTIKELMYK